MRKIKNLTAEQVTDGMDLTGQTIMITGCNSGIGLEAMRVLVLRGAHVFGAARTMEKAVSACSGVKGEAVPIVCDLSDPSSIISAVECINEPLDVLIANAGVMALLERILFCGVEAQMFVNHVGHAMLISGLLKKLKNNGRILILASAAHAWARSKDLNFNDMAWEKKQYNPRTAYAYSKLANILYTKELAKRLPSGQTANSIHPGIIDSSLWRHAHSESEKYKLISCELGAAATVFLATDPSVANISGAYFSGGAIGKPSAIAQDEKLAKELWEITEQLLAKF